MDLQGAAQALQQDLLRFQIRLNVCAHAQDIFGVALHAGMQRFERGSGGHDDLLT